MFTLAQWPIRLDRSPASFYSLAALSVSAEHRLRTTISHPEKDAVTSSEKTTTTDASTPETQVKVPLLDISGENAPLRDEMLAAITRVFDSGWFELKFCDLFLFCCLAFSCSQCQRLKSQTMWMTWNEKEKLSHKHLYVEKWSIYRMMKK